MEKRKTTKRVKTKENRGGGRVLFVLQGGYVFIYSFFIFD